jgi:hypothetical protein
MPWLRHLAVLFAFVAALVRPAPASAFTIASSGTRVGAFEVAGHLLVGELGAASREQHQGIVAAYDENASGYRFAVGGTGAFLEGTAGGAGLGRVGGMSLRVSEKGLGIVEGHLARFGPVPENAAMVARLRGALESGTRISGADASFYLHEVSEATMMGRGLSYEAAHAGALGKYGVSPFSVYHPNVIIANPGAFNSNWFNFWGIK